MDSNLILAVATVVLAGATMVLVGVTAYYAWQNHNMVGVLKRQADLTEKIESHGRADTQIMAAVLLTVANPMYDRNLRTIAVKVVNGDSSPVLSASLTIRAGKDPAGPPSWLPPVGATTSRVILKNAVMPGEIGWLRCGAADFYRVGEIDQNTSPLWPAQIIFDVESVGFLGQRVLQRYEWLIPEDAHRTSEVRFRIVQITPNVEGAEPVRYELGPAAHPAPPAPDKPEMIGA
jgi:hypothetical protein